MERRAGRGGAALCSIVGLLAGFAPSAGPDGGGEFELRARWQPMAGSKYRLHEGEPALQAMRAPKVAEESRSWPAESVSKLLPPLDSRDDQPFAVRVHAVLPFLRQLHPGAQERVTHMITHPGAFGRVLKQDESTLDVLYRVHAGFELVKGRANLAPAQFEGRLVLDRATGAVRHFSLELPPTRPNVDLNVTMGAGTVIADIGSVPAMGLSTAGPPPAVEPEALARARLELQRAFYPFAEIEWLPLAQGLERSITEERPMHLVILFGALGDESC